MSSITAIVIEKNGTIKEVSLKETDEETLYKKAGFKTKEGFSCHTQWTVNDLNDTSFTVSVYGKTTGRANQENKYEFPPPIDKTLFFGNCLLLNHVNGTAKSLIKKDWEAIYDYLYGGFADIDEGESECSEDDDDEDDDLPRTKSGYAKDGFVVDEDEEEDEEDEEEQEEEENEDEAEEDEEEEEAPRKKAKSKAKNAKMTKNAKNADKPEKKLTAASKNSKKKAKDTAPVSVFAGLEDNYLDCTSELSEESYI